MASSFSPTFYIGSIRIGTVEGASSVNIGHNTNSGFKSEKKHNQGFGSVSGDSNEFKDARTLLDDADFLDMFNGSDDIPDWLKEKILASLEEGEEIDVEGEADFSNDLNETNESDDNNENKDSTLK
ncbi:hypothetical protein J2S74_000962 [Evansella vedderi]|uniref:Uncharacterized protein n=1 Tax=Evansella vedderi TaxID=38282 RepID=A0ABT9ZQT3_9BACI|nr:hypothetical protein [Evansella vedderi]MDQ0253590.1 hypothetical protein [Evansella vedderi]